MNRKLPFLALFSTTIVYGLTNILLRYAGSQDYFSVVFFVLLFSTLMLLPGLVFSHGLGEMKSRHELRLVLPLGFFSAATWFLIYFAIMNTSIANAVLGYMTTPVFVIALSPFLLKERINVQVLIALVLALIGVTLIFDPRNLIRSIAPVGIISGMLAGVASAMVEIIGRKLKDQYSPLSLTFFGTSVGTLILLPFFLLNGSSIPSMNSLLIILLLSLGGISGGTLLYYALKHIIAQSVSIIMLLEPLISIVAAFILFLEIPSPLTVLGAGLLVAADAIIIQNQP